MPKVARTPAGVTAAAQAMVSRVATGRPLNKAEAETVSWLLKQPDVKAALGRAATLELAAAIGGGSEPLQEVSSLVNFSKLTDALAVPGWLTADLGLLREQLVGFPGLTRQQQADRMLSFVAAYAAHATTLLPASSEAARGEVARQFEAACAQAGLGQVVDVSTGRTGLELAAQFVRAKGPEEVERLRQQVKADAPSWVDRPAAFASPPDRLPPLESKADDDEKPAPGRKGTLGNKMLWNVLHLFRGGEEGTLSEVERRDAMNQLLVAAGLTLTLFAVLVVILVLL